MKTKTIEEKTKTIKKTKKEDNTNNLINATFLDRHGNKVNVSDVIDNEKDCWFLKNKNTWILTHDAIKTIARIAGISINYKVEESPNITPDYRNELEHIVRVTITCKADTPKNSETDVDGNTPCVHSDEREMTITGEANRVNTPNRGRGYLRKMAEKRAFDIAVLEHLKLYSSIYSEEEAEDFKQVKEPVLMPGTKDFEAITTEINAIINAKEVTDLKRIATKIKKRKDEGRYNDKQIVYLKELYQKEIGKRNKPF